MMYHRFRYRHNPEDVVENLWDLLHQTEDSPSNLAAWQRLYYTSEALGAVIHIDLADGRRGTLIECDSYNRTIRIFLTEGYSYPALEFRRISIPLGRLGALEPIMSIDMAGAEKRIWLADMRRRLDTY